MHAEVYEWVNACLIVLGPPSTVVDLGGRNWNGTLRPLFPKATYISVDIAEGNGVDVVCNAALYKPAEPVECVVCTEVLEHSPEAPLIVQNAMSILRPGGMLIMTCASPERTPHGCGSVEPQIGEYYRGPSAHEVAAWMAGAYVGRVVENSDHCDIYAWAIKAAEE